LPGQSSAMTFRVPCASRRFGTVITSPLRRLARQDLPRLAASKSSSTGRLALILKSRYAGFGCDARRRLTGPNADTPRPVAPGLARNAGQGCAAALYINPARASGALLFGYFLLGTQEKVPRPTGRNCKTIGAVPNCPSDIHRSRARTAAPRGSPIPPATGHGACHRRRTPCRWKCSRPCRLRCCP